MRHTDVMFDYELSAVLFNGLGMVKFNALGASLTADGARTAADLDLLRDSVARFVGDVLRPEVATFAIAAHTHAQTGSAQERDQFLAPSCVTPEVFSAGVIGYVRPHPWLSEVRVAIEAASGSPDGLFVAWNTSMQISDQWETHLAGLPEVFVGAAEKLGIKLRAEGQ